MIIKHLSGLSQKKIVLASNSPRRQQLLSLIGLNVVKYPSKFDETLSPADFATPDLYAIETAKHKALDVVSRYKEVWDLVIAADTIVELDGQVLEKPADEEDAVNTLMKMSSRQHTVFTGVVLLLPSQNGPIVRSFHSASQVWFDSFDQDEALAYVRTKEPLDKAGSYGIQGFGSLLVRKIDGCYFNVMGLPLNALANNLKTAMDANLV